MKKERIEKQFKKITGGINQELINEVCFSLVEDYRRGELGYWPRCNLDAINREDNGENELRDKIQSWVSSCFGLRSRDKITFIEQTVIVGQENSVK